MKKKILIEIAVKMDRTLTKAVYNILLKIDTSRLNKKLDTELSGLLFFQLRGFDINDISLVDIDMADDNTIIIL